MEQSQPQQRLAEYLTIGEAADLLGVSPCTLRNWDRDGKLRTQRHPKNGYRLYRREELEAILQPGAPGARLAPPVGWEEAGELAHIVQFYEDDNFLVRSVSRFLGTALHAGDGVVLIATPAHRNAIQRRLRAQGLDLSAARREGQLVALDAAQTLARLLVNGAPDPGRFREVVGAVLARAARGRGQVRAFGEMVALLWAEGKRDAAIHLEELWNDLQKAQPFALYCAYPLRAFTDEAHDAPFNGICACHSHIIPGDSYAALGREDERLQAVARLQRKAQVLEAEIAHRRQVEARLVALQQQQRDELADLHRLQQMSAQLSTGLELGPILDETLRTACALAGTDRGLLSLCDEEQEGLRLGACLGFDDAFVRLIERVPPGGGACGTCLKERRRVVVEDVETDPIFAPYRQAARQAGFRAVHSTPLITRSGRVVGVLSAHFREPHCPPEREKHLLDLCARQAVDFIENARLYRRAQEEIAERRRAEEALRQADRRKNDFLAVLAHEERNFLAPIRNVVDALRRLDLAEPTTKWAVDVLHRQVGQLTRLVDDLLDLTRIAQHKLEFRKERIDLAEVVAQAIETCQPFVESRRHTLTVSLPPGPVPLEADRTRLGQVLTNLVTNSAKYTPEGGRIWLTVRREGGEAVIAVRDNGVGIPAERLGGIFELFSQVEETLERSQGGLGIGLALVRSLVQMHGGTVEAHSDGPGKGSEFTVRLPAPPEGESRETTGQGQPGAGKGSPDRILVVDDNPDAAESLAMLLRLGGHEVRTALDGPSALDAARAFAPRVVLLDLGLPGVDGLEVARRLRREHPGREMVLVAVTGYGTDEDRRRAREAGFDEYLVKPIELDALGRLLAGPGKGRGR